MAFGGRCVPPMALGCAGTVPLGNCLRTRRPPVSSLGASTSTRNNTSKASRPTFGNSKSAATRSCTNGSKTAKSGLSPTTNWNTIKRSSSPCKRRWRRWKRSTRPFRNSRSANQKDANTRLSLAQNLSLDSVANPIRSFQKTAYNLPRVSC